MNNEVKYVLSQAILNGACMQSSKATDWKSLAWLFFSPQGCEFCKKHNFPSIGEFRKMKGHVESYGVHIEEPINAYNEDIAIIGDSGSISELSFKGVSKTYKVILMHGARVHISAGNYAVVRIENISGYYSITNDGTAKILL